ncbi:MerR family transcriptional regulator [Companilactobacillus sp.]|uniref:MerR family transcriptional regulator n=1 Tax=Companilactobacillus sp. TaxID=2767905 RepID=UPI0025C2A674|nr:MerR family transcriptional regulator [Companilactobacillus sp.]MCH4009817.1 MerR family transcriptional regulator [Companilactobacillus sp.]MCH4052507.1 MerR family transcriptional regulator [Companilactobacillus sp.]MCH4077759.1 MerR family transcriptional regulator [Companilactobacillus sp.]MCH4126335.1 MerR family transcriptional regulator [Companilactobacillus sp.]MCI1312043.1 MerR family transcriptional regulator [Companilactobacillus sp.]
MANYTVQQVAKKMGLTSYTVRYYHDHGLLPFVKRDKNNNRVFDDVDLEWLKMITCLRSTGMPLDQIKHYFDLVIDGEETVPERYQIMLDQQKKTLDEIQELQQHLNTINFKVDHYADIMKSHEPDSFEPSNIREKEANKAKVDSK